jgi:hypothetical protein
MVMHPFRLVADCAALATIRVSTSMLLAAVTVHIFAFLCRISDKPVAPYWEISDFYTGVAKGLIGVCPTYAAGGLMESAGLAGKDALQPERFEGKVLQKLGQPFMQAHERAALHGDWAMDA